MLRILLIIIATACSSCATFQQGTDEPAWSQKLKTGTHNLGALSAADCAQRDGVWLGVDGSEIALCQIRVTDGGKSCTDHSQCQGFCVSDVSAEYGARITGVCTRDYYQSDCVQGVSRGRAEAIVCRCP